MKNISAWAILHPVTPVVLFVVLLFMGSVAFLRLPVTLNPDVSFPLVLVLVSQPGASPQDQLPNPIRTMEASTYLVFVRGKTNRITDSPEGRSVLR